MEALRIVEYGHERFRAAMMTDLQPREEASQSRYGGSPEGEQVVSVSEIWSVLVRRRALIMMLTILFLIVGLVLAYVVKPLYKSKAVIQLGMVMSGKQPVSIEDPAALVARLKAVYGVGERSWLNRGRPRLTTVSAPTDAPSVIELQAKAADPQGARKLLTTLVDGIVRADRQVYEDYRSDKRKALAVTTQAISAIEQQIIRQPTEPPKSPDASLNEAQIQFLTRVQAMTDLQALTQRKERLQLALSPVGSSATHVVVAPTLANRPSYRLQALLIVLSLLFGLLIGVAAAVVVEFRSRLTTGP